MGVTQLIREADRRREVEGLNHGDFARQLGVSGGLWSLTRSGRKPLRRKLARAIGQRYEDLRTLAEVEVGRELVSR